MARENFGRAIKRIRNAKGLTQEQVVGRLLGFYSETSSYARIEAGSRGPSRESALAILTNGLQLNDPVEIDRLLALAGYEGQTQAPRDTVQEQPTPETSSPPVSAAQVEQRSEARDGSAASRRTRARMWWLLALALFGTIGVSLLTADRWFVLLSTFAYGGLYVLSLLLETVYVERKPWLPELAGSVFALMSISSAAALLADHAIVTGYGVSALSICGLFAAAQWFATARFLPSHPVVGTHTVQGAHLKNTEYFLLIVFLFWVPPFHCIQVLEQASRSGRLAALQPVLHDVLIRTGGIFTLNVTPLLGVLACLVVLSVAMRTYILDKLEPSRHLNAYSLLFYARAALYFGLCLFCIAWFADNLARFE